MSCWHGWHGCGPLYGPPYGRSWYGPAEWEDELEQPIRRRGRRYGLLDRPVASDELEARLADLRDAVRRVESELSDLRRHEDAAAEGP
jgi:hypothetical protein